MPLINPLASGAGSQGMGRETVSLLHDRNRAAGGTRHCPISRRRTPRISLRSICPSVTPFVSGTNA